MRFFNLVFALISTGSGFALVSIPNLPRHVRIGLFALMSLTGITLFPSALDAIGEINVRLHRMGVWVALDKFMEDRRRHFQEQQQAALREVQKRQAAMEAERQRQATMETERLRLASLKEEQQREALIQQDPPRPSLSWTISNSTGYELELQFFSSSGEYWPSEARGYILSSGRTDSYGMSCRYEGEMICYGAWPLHIQSRRYWGVGRNRAHSCTACCYVCDGSLISRSLMN